MQMADQAMAAQDCPISETFMQVAVVEEVAQRLLLERVVAELGAQEQLHQRRTELDLAQPHLPEAVEEEPGQLRQDRVRRAAAVPMA